MTYSGKLPDLIDMDIVEGNSLIEPYRGKVDHLTKLQFEKIRSQVLRPLKNPRSSSKKKVFAKIFQLWLSLYSIHFTENSMQNCTKSSKNAENVGYPTYN